MREKLLEVRKRAMIEARLMLRDARSMLREECAQGTTEYAILVGVLVVIAILAIIAFKGKVSELWDAIASGINKL